MHALIKVNEAENIMQANILPFYTPTSPRWGQQLKTFFFLKKVIMHIKKGKYVLNIMQVWPYAHPWQFGLDKKVRHSYCADKHFLIDSLCLWSELYPRWTKVLEKRDLYILWLTTSPCDKNLGERSKANGPFCCCF